MGEKHWLQEGLKEEKIYLHRAKNHINKIHVKFLYYKAVICNVTAFLFDG